MSDMPNVTTDTADVVPMCKLKDMIGDVRDYVSHVTHDMLNALHADLEAAREELHESRQQAEEARTHQERRRAIGVPAAIILMIILPGFHVSPDLLAPVVFVPDVLVLVAFKRSRDRLVARCRLLLARAKSKANVS